MKARYLVTVLSMAIIASGCVAERENRIAPPRPTKVVFHEGRPMTDGTYGGGPACRPCHEGIYRFWEGSSHAGSLLTLRSSGEGENDACLRCHTTGYGERTGYGAAAGAAGLASVGCESCHGPSAEHAGSDSPALVPTNYGGDCLPCETNKICRQCHTSKHSPSFQFERYLQSVSCPNTRREAGARTGAVED
jgi:hypothetical protein